MALDITLIVIMLISAFLAMVRGFMREILSLVGWAVTAAAAVLAYRRLTGPVLQFFNGANEMVIKGATVLAVTIVALIVTTYLTTRISDKILDSKIGALDRTLGLLFGLARGLLLVAIAFGFYHWFFIKDDTDALSCATCCAESKDNDPYTRNAKSRCVLLRTDRWIESQIGENFEKSLMDFLNWLKNPNSTPEPQQTTGAAAETQWHIRR